MMWLSDETTDHLLHVGEAPDFSGTKYRILSELARGGMGVVYVAEDPELRREVAIKVSSGEIASPEATARMVREAEIIASLEHPGVVPVHDVGNLPDGRVFYVMKLVRGRRLDEHLRQVHGRAERLRIFIRICEAVSFAHASGVIHRDLKPQNVMIGAFGEVLVMDWGIAKVRNEDEIASGAESGRPTPGRGTENGTVIGTRGYMAPEQERGDLAIVDARSDVFSLGAILQFLMQDTGEKTPRPVTAIISKAMAGSREERYGMASELETEVQRYLDGVPVGAYRESIRERVGRWVGRNRTAVALVLAYILMRFVLLLWTRM